MAVQPQISTTRCYARVRVVPEDLRSVQVVVASEEADGWEDDVGPIDHMIFEAHEVDQRALLCGRFRSTGKGEEERQPDRMRKIVVCDLI